MLELAPCSLEDANAFVAMHHRHHKPTPVAMFCVAAASDGEIVGVAIVGLPKARMSMDGWTVEITRLASDGSRNVCSLLYGAARRAAFALGYRRVLTYTLADESGSSLRASGYMLEAAIKGESWMRRSRNGGRFVDDRNPTGDKVRWSAGVKCTAPVPRVRRPAVELPLFADAVDPQVTDSGTPSTRDKETHEQDMRLAGLREGQTPRAETPIKQKGPR